MSFSIKKIAIFSLLVFTLFACEKPGDIGLDIKNPGLSFGVIYTDTVTVQTSTVLLDSVRTSLTSENVYLTARQYADPQLGTVTANSFFGFYLATNDTLNLGQLPTVDSVVLFLQNSYVYGDTNAVQSLNVHLLQNSVQQDTIYENYYNSDNIPFSSAVGSVQSRPGARDSGDTLRIPLDASVGNQLLALNGKSDAEFAGGFYGFALAPQAGSTGAVVSFNGISSATRLRLYYRNSSSQTQSTFDSFINGNYTFNQITSSKTEPWNSLAVNQPIPSATTSQETVVEGGVGLMTKIDIPHLQKLDENKTIRLNQAFLIVQPVQSKTSSITPPPAELILYRSNTNGLPLRTSTGIYVPAEELGFPIKLSCSSTDNLYKFDITQYLQRILNNEENASTTMYLSLPSFSLNSFYPRRPNNLGNAVLPAYPIALGSSLENSVSRLILGNQQHPTNPLKLQIYYTEIK